MSDIAGDLDSILEVEELNRETLSLVATRIERSRTPEQLVYREVEVDQVWRLLDSAAPALELPEATQAELRIQIEKIHDFIGVDADVQRAAHSLRLALSGAHL